MLKIAKYVVADIFRNKVLIGYALLLAAACWSAFALEDNSSKGTLTVLSIVLLLVPLVSIIFATIYFYNSAEFIELMLSQPVKRSRIWTSLFLGVGFSLVTAFFLSAGMAILFYAPLGMALILIVCGTLLSLIFAALAALSCMLARDKAKGIGIAILTWVFFAFLFDAMLLFTMFQLADYPIEKPMMVATAFNPIDLARILVLLKLDASALMGYTGAVFKEFFGKPVGVAVSLLLLVMWVLIPFGISLLKFKRKDL